ncbi:hypothetical protein R6Q59_019141 [Mikania micrantha]|uniref:Uncharacterized protein n=1 Tax=Mikania micrantha TaxID=192012 RepID=A0A5N6LYB4_9ASTR|nr:hypothetical protein E3N88_34505 [Mikania micrantha]
MCVIFKFCSLVMKTIRISSSGVATLHVRWHNGVVICLLLSYSDLTSEKPQGGYDDDGASISPPAVACENCNSFPYPCTSQLPPPPPPHKGSSIYAAPPPPLPTAPVGNNCPPVAPVTCCQYTPPNPMPNYGYPYSYGNYTQSSSVSRTQCWSFMMKLLIPFVYVFGV